MELQGLKCGSYIKYYGYNYMRASGNNYCAPIPLGLICMHWMLMKAFRPPSCKLLKQFLAAVLLNLGWTSVPWRKDRIYSSSGCWIWFFAELKDSWLAFGRVVLVFCPFCPGMSLPTSCFRKSVAKSKPVVLTSRSLEYWWNVCVWILAEYTSEQKLMGNVESKT